MPLVRLLGEKLLTSTGLVSTREALKGASAVGLYFSASWCPPCRGFTPDFVQSYTNRLEAKGLRCVLVSSDQSEEAFKEYFAKMPWLALPYSERQLKEELSAKFGVKSIPSLALVDLEGNTITTEARDAVVRDPEGQDFPWRPPLVRDLAQGSPGKINESPTLLCLCESIDATQQQKAFQEILSVAQTWQPSPELRKTFAFFTGSGGGLSTQVRALCGLQSSEVPRLVILDIPDNGGFYLGPEGQNAVEEDSMRKFLQDYEAGVLERRQLSG